MDLQALRTTIDAQSARIEVARREVVPNLAFEAFYGRRGGDRSPARGRDRHPHPPVQPQPGPIAEARSAERQAVADTRGRACSRSAGRS